MEERDLGVVQVAPLPVRLWPAKIREPDIFFFAKEHTDRIGEHVCGVPDLLVEVTSPSTARLDRMEKFAEYEAGGVREYWLVDPEARQADFYVLGPDGRYDRRRADAAGIYRSQVVEGLWVRPEWLWQDPLPPVLVVLRELGLLG